MKKNQKKILFITFAFTLSIAVLSAINFFSKYEEKEVLSMSYMDVSSDGLKKDLESMLEKTYGKNYKKVIEKNSIATESANKINKIFTSKLTNELNYPEYIGGIYIDDNDDLIIQIKESKISLENKELKSTYTNIRSIDENSKTEYVRYSYNELKTIYNTIINSFGVTKASDNVGATYIDIINNRVVVELVDNSIEMQREFKENIIDSNIVFFKKGDAYGVLNAYNSGQSAGTNLCTIGFRAKKGNSSKGYITAGHCVRNRAIGAAYGDGTIRDYKQGDNVDAAYIETSTTINTKIQYPTYPATYLSSLAGYAPNVVVGTKVAKSGATTGATSGKITSLNATWSIPGSVGDDRIIVNNMIQTDVHSETGDSGAPLFPINAQTVTLLGILRGFYGGHGYYTNYNYIKDAFGITIY